MLTKTIGQLDTEVAPSTADYIEIEHGGASGKLSFAEVASAYSSTAESLAGTSNSYLMTPLKVREAFSANTEAPVYACRAWCNFDGTTTSSSLTSTYTRASGATTVVVVSTSHGCISGNIEYLDFTSGTASDNSYIVTVVDQDTLNVTTVSTSSTLGNVTLRRHPRFASGNVASVAYISTGYSYINFSAEMPSTYYSIYGTAVGGATANLSAFISAPYLTRSKYTFDLQVSQTGGTAANYQAVSDVSVAVIA